MTRSWLPPTDSGLPPQDDDAEMVQFNVRVPKRLVRELDAWLQTDNAARHYTKRSRSELVRDALIWSVENRPDLGGKLGLVCWNPSAPAMS